MMLLLLWLMTTATSSQEVKPGCQGKCVNVSVPYPSVFEKPDCSMKEHFFLDCSSNDGDAELWFGRNMPAYDVSVYEGTVTVSIDMAYDCYDKSGMPFLSVSHTWIWPFHVLKLQKHVDSYWL